MPKKYNTWRGLQSLTLNPKRRGIADCHSHLLTEDTLTREQYSSLKNMSLEDKWREADKTRNRALSTFSGRLDEAIERRRRQGITFCRSYIDITPDIGLEALKTAMEAKRRWKDWGFYLQIAVYPVRGIKSKARRELLEGACDIPEVEVIGCLPSRGRSGVEDIAGTLLSMEYYFEVACEFDKALDMQVDQKNHPSESETRLLAELAAQYRQRGYERPVAVTHGISMSAWQNREFLTETLKLMAENDVSLIVCPGAALNNEQLWEVDAPTHNSIAPWVSAGSLGVNVALGLDNVCDLYMPSSNGDVWQEVKILWDAVRFQGDISEIADILTVNGRKAMGLPL